MVAGAKQEGLNCLHVHHVGAHRAEDLESKSQAPFPPGVSRISRVFDGGNLLLVVVDIVKGLLDTPQSLLIPLVTTDVIRAGLRR